MPLTTRTSYPAVSEKCVLAEAFALVNPEAAMQALAESALSSAQASDDEAWATLAMVKKQKQKGDFHFVTSQRRERKPAGTFQILSHKRLNQRG